MSISCASKNSQNADNRVDSAVVDTAFTNNIKFDESTLPYNGGILIANFGTETLNPLNTEGKGYILYLKNDTLREFIPADGNLNAPKGMQIIENHLFIADVNRVVVYDLNNKTSKPQIITFPQGEIFVNDLTSKNDTLYASVSNTGNLYKLVISDINNINNQILTKYANVVGANGIIISYDKMYIASYPANTGKPTNENVVYVINDLEHPNPEKLITQPGIYDGVQISADKNTLYVSNWKPVEIIGINLKDKSISTVLENSEIKSIADFTLQDSTFYIPDLAGSKLFIEKIK